MGSSSQHYRATPFTEDAENATTPGSSYWTSRRSSSRDWSERVGELRWMWDLHVWVSASLFSVVAVLCLFTVLRLRSQLSQSRNLTSLNVFLGILASSRLLVLYLDPYGSKLILPAVMLQVLWDLGYPCLVSAFCLLQLSVVREAKVTRLSESTASIVITLHFCLIITSGVLGAVQNWLRIVWIITQVVFIIWGGFLFLSTLLGCLRILRSIVNLPLRLLTQVDPGCEVTSIEPLGTFSEEVPQRPIHHHGPGIHITDVDEQTYSYASEVSLAHKMKRSESVPMRCQEDPATIKPLIVSSLPEIHQCQQDPPHHSTEDRGPETIFRFEPKQSLSPSLMPSVFAEDIKHPCRSRFEKNLRHLVVTSCLGIALCLLRAYDVFGLDGLMACGNTGPILQWFFFQTFSRFVELSMSFSMVCGSQRSMTSRYYYYRN